MTRSNLHLKQDIVLASRTCVFFFVVFGSNMCVFIVYSYCNIAVYDKKLTLVLERSKYFMTRSNLHLDVDIVLASRTCVFFIVVFGSNMCMNIVYLLLKYSYM